MIFFKRIDFQKCFQNIYPKATFVSEIKKCKQEIVSKKHCCLIMDLDVELINWLYTIEPTIKYVIIAQTNEWIVPYRYIDYLMSAGYTIEIVPIKDLRENPQFYAQLCQQ
jgi:hypothetical protein